MLFDQVTPQPARAQLEELRARGLPGGGVIVPVAGIDCPMVTNPSIPFLSDGMEVLAVRADAGGTQPSSRTVFCYWQDSAWRPIPGAPMLALEDPFVTRVAGQLVLGGVRVIVENGSVTAWVTDFYMGQSIHTLRHLFTGPWHMKDIRLVELRDGRIGVFSRPQGQKMLDRYGCIAQIGFAVFDRLQDITAEGIEAAPFLQGLFLPDEWGGANQAYLLDNGLVGVIGHKAWGEHIGGEHVLHYYSMAFALDPVSRRFTEPRIICARECFADGPAAQPRVRDVTFTAGIVRRGARAELYSGLSDCQIGRIEIDDPLRMYEVIEY